MYQAEGSERTEAYLFSRQQSRRESFGCTKQTGTQVQDTQCVLLPNLIGKANGKPSDTATAAEKKQKSHSPPPIITGKTGGEVRVLTYCPTLGRTLVH